MRGADIFVSYRREDAAAIVRLSGWLVERFGESRVFVDSSGIRGGERFPEVIVDAIRTSKVVVAVIGPHWRDGLDRESDWVRRELSEALAASRPIVPILLDDVPLPGRGDLPPDLMEVADREAVRLSGQTLREDVARLFEVLEDLGTASATKTAFADVPKTARRELRAAWDAPYDRAQTEQLLVAALAAHGITVSGRRDGDLLLQRGNRWTTRLFGGFSGPASRLPLTRRLRIQDRGAAVAIEVLLAENWGRGVIQSRTARYTVVFENVVTDLRRATEQTPST